MILPIVPPAPILLSARSRVEEAEPRLHMGALALSGSLPYSTCHKRP